MSLPLPNRLDGGILISSLSSSYLLVGYFNISSVEINQCAGSEMPFGGTHKCPSSMTVCERLFPFPSDGSRLFCLSSVCIGMEVASSPIPTSASVRDPTEINRKSSTGEISNIST